MPSRPMQDLLRSRHERQRAGADQPPATVAETRAAFAPAGPVHPVPADVLATDVTAGGVPAHWLDAPEVDPDRALLFLHGGGYRLGSIRSDGERAARPGRAAATRVRLPEHPLAAEPPVRAPRTAR